MEAYSVYSNPDAEKSVLGAALQDEKCARLVADMAPDDFHLPEHKQLHAAVRALVKLGQPVDFITLDTQRNDQREDDWEGCVTPSACCMRQSALSSKGSDRMNRSTQEIALTIAELAQPISVLIANETVINAIKEYAQGEMTRTQVALKIAPVLCRDHLLETAAVLSVLTNKPAGDILAQPFKQTVKDVTALFDRDVA